MLIFSFLEIKQIDNIKEIERNYNNLRVFEKLIKDLILFGVSKTRKYFISTCIRNLKINQKSYMTLLINLPGLLQKVSLFMTLYCYILYHRSRHSSYHRPGVP